MSNTTQQTSAVATACEGLKTQLISLIETFLWIALVIAVLTALADLAVKLAPLFSRERGFAAPRTAAPVDPVKFLDALKGLIDVLTKAPIWIAMVLTALALLWATHELMPAYCPLPR